MPIETITICAISMLLGLNYLYRYFRAKRTGIVEAQIRYDKRLLQGNAARDLLLQWLGGGIILVINTVLGYFFPIAAMIIGVIVILYIASFESSAI
jgi:hypothetical protein